MTEDEAFKEKKKFFEDLGFEVSVFDTSIIISHSSSSESITYLPIKNFLYSSNKQIIDEVVLSIVEGFTRTEP